MWENPKFFWQYFFEFFCNGLNPIQKEIRSRLAQNKTKPEPAQKENLLSTRLDSAQPYRLEY